MFKLNIHQTKTHLSQYLPRVAAGEIITLCRHNLPIAEIRPLPNPHIRRKRTFYRLRIAGVRPLPKPQQPPRPVGLAKGQFTIPENFFSPLPDELEMAFGGMKS